MSEIYSPQDGFVRVDCDYAADGLWNRRGAALSGEQLGLSPALRLALEAWQVYHDGQNPGEAYHFEQAAWEQLGRKIAALVQAERTDLQVVFANDAPYPGEYRCKNCGRLHLPGDPPSTCAPLDYE